MKKEIKQKEVENCKNAQFCAKMKNGKITLVTVNVLMAIKLLLKMLVLRIWGEYFTKDGTIYMQCYVVN